MRFKLRPHGRWVRVGHSKNRPRAGRDPPWCVMSGCVGMRGSGALYLLYGLANTLLPTHTSLSMARRSVFRSVVHRPGSSQSLRLGRRGSNVCAPRSDHGGSGGGLGVPPCQQRAETIKSAHHGAEAIMSAHQELTKSTHQRRCIKSASDAVARAVACSTRPSN